MQVHSLPAGSLGDQTVYLDGQEAKHIVKVMRHGVGDPIVFSDGKGNFLHTVIDRCSQTDVHARIEKIEADPRELGAPWSTLALALLKGEHFEMALEKAVELGVHRIIPLRADHCVVKWKEKGGSRKLDRWSRIAESAMKQAGRSWLPEVCEPVTVAQFIAALPEDSQLVVGDEEEHALSVRDFSFAVDRPLIAVVGPEGAFSAEEKQRLADAGATAVTLSNYVLRAETAAVSLITALHLTRL